MSDRKRVVALTLLAATLVVAVTGIWVWSGVLGAERGANSLRHLLRDIHLYSGWAFVGAVAAHLALNGRAMLRHLGVSPRNPASPGMLRRR